MKMSITRFQFLRTSVESAGASELKKYLEQEQEAKSKGEEALDSFNVQVEHEYEMKNEESSEDTADSTAESAPDESSEDMKESEETDTEEETPQTEETVKEKKEGSSEEKSEKDESDKKDSEKEPEEDKEEIPEEDDKNTSTECMRNMWVNRVPLRLSVEDYGQTSTDGEKLKYAAGQVWNGAKYVAGHAIDLTLKTGAILLEIGIRYGPTVANKLYHGVVFLFTKLVKLTLVTTDRISRYKYRTNNSFEELKKKIEDMKALVENIAEESKDEETAYSFKNEKIINDLKIGSKVDVITNVKAFNSFIKNTVLELDKCISEESAKTKHMARLSSEITADVSPSSFKITIPNKTISKGRLDGYLVDSDYLESYVSKETICGDVRILAYLPKEEIGNLDAARKAYNHSKMFLAMDPISFKQVEEIPYLTKDQTLSLLEEISILCGICLQHQQLYEKLLREKGSFKLMLRNYFNSLLESEDKVSLKNTSLELMYLKTMFVDKVYIPMAMDVHELCIKVINSSLTLCKESSRGWK